ncbi:proline-, glutamic acid- and leucine-rich protein 1-like [Anopheles nili]|uniref:proline-, glutamic acid- and leucine-rich protein 1-like n=1 Tax=Anopheles nili TaxID=185578 RepID=UPI00237A6AA7|nr:proline-, glutamic acid- and leucine-rich protein 1-like [Anopheles nili]
MEGIGQIFGSVVSNDDSLLTVFLESIDEHQTFWTDSRNDLGLIFNKIGALMDVSKTRDRGLRIFIHLLTSCPLEQVEDKALHIVRICVKLLNQRGPVESIPLVYKVLQQLIKRSLSSNDLHKLFVSYLPKILESVEPALTPPAIPAALSFLELAMLHYASTCGLHKNRIETFLFSLVDDTNRSVVSGTAKCLLLLQQIRGGGQHGTLHKKTWEEYYLKLVDTIHDLLNKIFAHTPESFDEEENLECLKLPPVELTKNAIRNAQMLAVRASNLIAFLQQAIVGAYPVPKPIIPFKAINLVLRGLSVSCEAMGTNPIAENITFGTSLPLIHYELLEVLDALVLVLGSNLFIFGDSICEMFPKCLKATYRASHGSDGNKKSFTRLRTKIYGSIQLWCEKTRYGSNIETVNEPIFEHIVRDITPFESEITLKMGTTTQKRLSSKAKRKLQKEQNSATALNQTHSNGNGIAENKEQLIDRGNESLCRAALECLATILQSAGCFIKPVTHKLLQEHIVPLSFALLANHQQTTGLYSDNNARAALLRALASLIVNPHHHCPPPLQYAGYIFNTLQTTDSSLTVRATAAELARTMELVLHPWKETLYFAMDQAAVKDALANKKKHNLSTFLKKQPCQPNSHDHVIANGTSTENKTNEVVQTEQNVLEEKSPPSPMAIDAETYESEGEINESLAVTEASDESNHVTEFVFEDEPVGWVEFESCSTQDKSTNNFENHQQKLPSDNDTTAHYNDGVILKTNGSATQIDEANVVSILDSDEELDKITSNVDDDVVEIPTEIKNSLNDSKNTKGYPKHSSPIREDEDVQIVSSKKMKLSNGDGTDTVKNIDDIVEEMVAEFVDEP